MKKSEREEVLKLIDDSLAKVKEGDIVQGEIVRLSHREAIVDVGMKSEGVISLSEFDDPSELKIGDKFEVLLESMEADEGVVLLSKSKADSLRIWERIEESYKKGTTVEGKISKLVKGGFIVNIKGIEAFLPGSQLDVFEVKDTENLIGQTMTFRAIKVDKLRNNIVLSRKVILEEELRKKRAEFWETVEEEQVLEGVVKNITDFGVFVDVGGVDGLVHITDLSWGRTTHPSEVVRVGDKLKVKVLSIDMEQKHVALGVKQLTPYPWENIEKRLVVSSEIKGKVTSLTDYGAFVELEPGVEGLIHISEMSWTQRIHHPSQILAVGDTVHAVVLNVDTAQEKISLSLRQTQPNPWEKAKENYPEGTTVTGIVKSFSAFGAFVELEDGIEGLLHIRDIAWAKHIDHPSDILKKRQRIKCKVLSVDPENQRLSLGLKQLKDDPLIGLKEAFDTPIKAKIKEIVERGIVVKFEVAKETVDGFVPFSHLAKPNLKNIKDKYEIGEEINLTLLEVDEERRKIILSEKEYISSRERKEYEEYIEKSGEKDKTKKKPEDKAKEKAKDKIEEKTEDKTDDKT